MEKRVRVRYAPSPTGYLHIGGARSALFNYLFAKSQGGDFVLRVEDTDIERNVPGAEESQLHDLIWLGIVPDESPEKPNPRYAPYRQTEKLDVYQQFASWLVEHGYAYECYCSEEELQASRDNQIASGIAAPQYDRHCLHLSELERLAYREQGRKPTIRIRVKDHHEISFVDLVRGKVTFNNDDIGDWVIMKSNGIPTYNFAVVIDDHLMEITHVLRGEEHLSNTPKQIQVYEYFGWEIPQFGHMTIIVNENGKKLSKRDLNILQFMSQYRELGYLPEAIFNFILLLGWTPSEQREIYTLSEAAKAFSLDRLSRSPSMFDPQKLAWMNAHYIKAMDETNYFSFIRPFILKALPKQEHDEKYLYFLAMLFKEQIKSGQEIIDLIAPLFAPLPALEGEAIEIMALQTTPKVIEAFATALAKVTSIEPEVIKQLFKDIQGSLGVKGKALYMPIRLKLTGMMHGLEMINIIKVLGQEESLRRLAK